MPMTEQLLAQAVIDEAEDAARRARFPAGAGIAFEQLADAGQEGTLDALRAVEPVSWLPSLGCWLVTGHAAARDALAPRAGLTTAARENLVRCSLGHMMLSADGEQHTRLRAPFEQPFRMREVGELYTTVIDQEVAALISTIRPAGHCEIGSAFAAPYAIRMAGHILGLSLGDVARIHGFYAAFAGAMVYDGDPAPQRLADAARSQLDTILHREFARCRRAPDGSLAAQVTGDRVTTLTDAEIAAQMRVIMFGAIETVQSAIMNTLLLLVGDPPTLARARDDHALLANAIEESMRLLPPVAFIERWVLAPVIIGGVEIATGEFVGISVLAANRDPAVFADPLRFDPARDNARRGLAFSSGIHHCLGVHLARIEILAALRAILEQFPSLALAAYDEPAGFAFRRPATLTLTWKTPR
jgi:cytochrome P450